MGSDLTHASILPVDRKNRLVAATSSGHRVLLDVRAPPLPWLLFQTIPIPASYTYTHTQLEGKEAKEADIQSLCRWFVAWLLLIYQRNGIDSPIGSRFVLNVGANLCFGSRTKPSGCRRQIKHRFSNKRPLASSWAHYRSGGGDLACVRNFKLTPSKKCVCVEACWWSTRNGSSVASACSSFIFQFAYSCFDRFGSYIWSHMFVACAE